MEGPSLDSQPSHSGSSWLPSLLRLDLTRDGWILLAARFMRLFSFGWVSIGLAMYLFHAGWSGLDIGLLFGFVLLSDLCATLYFAATADSIGRRATLLLCAGLHALAGVCFTTQSSWWGLLLAGVVGILSPTGGEVGPFMSVEQHCLADCAPSDQLSRLYSAHQLVGYLGQALGALLAGLAASSLQSNNEWTIVSAMRFILAGYAVCGGILVALYFFLSNSIESLHVRDSTSMQELAARFTLRQPQSRHAVWKLCLLLAVDAFASGFLMHTFLVYFFASALSFQLSLANVGLLLLLCNLAAGLSAATVSFASEQVGALPLLLGLHLPAHALLILIPFLSDARIAGSVLLLRFAMMQMDSPARAALIAHSVPQDDRAAVAQITALVRGVVLSASPVLAGLLLDDPQRQFRFALPLLLAGCVKVAYDLLLARGYKAAMAAEPAASGPSYAQVGVSVANLRPQQDTSLYDEEADETVR